MARSLNEVKLIGNLGADPEIKSIGKGDKRVANLSLATSRQWQDGNGDKHEKTEWHRISVFTPALIGIIEKYVKKGDRIYVCGRLEYSKQGEGDSARFFTSIVVNGPMSEIILLGNSGGEGGNQRAASNSNGKSASAQRNAPAAAAAAASAGSDIGFTEDDDIPF